VITVYNVREEWALRSECGKKLYRWTAREVTTRLGVVEIRALAMRWLVGWDSERSAGTRF
jgi:hypothetical protein